MARLQQRKQAAVTTGMAEQPAFPARMVYGLYELSSGTGSLAPVVRAARPSIADLTSAPGRQDHTTSPSAASSLVLRDRTRPPHPLLNVRDDAYAPPIEPGPGYKNTISVKQKQN